MRNHPGAFRGFFSTLAAATFLAMTLSSCAVTVALPGGGSTTTPIKPPTNIGPGIGAGASGGSTPETKPAPSEPTTGGGDDGENSGEQKPPDDKEPDSENTDKKPENPDSNTGKENSGTDDSKKPESEEAGYKTKYSRTDYDPTWTISESNGKLVLKKYVVFNKTAAANVQLPTGDEYVIGPYAIVMKDGTRNDIRGVTIPNEVTQIENRSFQGLYITEIEIPASVKAIGSEAFESCTKLHTITLKGNYSENQLGNRIFANCIELSEVVFEAPVDSLPSGTFEFAGPSEISPLRIILPQGLNEIESKAFYWANVKSLFIPASVTKIDELAFDNAYIETVYFGGDQESWNKITQNGSIFISDDIQYNQTPSSVPASEPTPELFTCLFSIF